MDFSRIDLAPEMKAFWDDDVFAFFDENLH